MRPTVYTTIPGVLLYGQTVRPDAREFLETLGQFAEVVAVSTGQSDSQSASLQKAGLLYLISNVYGWDNADWIKRPEIWLLIGSEESPTAIMGLLGLRGDMAVPALKQAAYDKHYIRCAKFTGSNHPQRLGELMDEIRRKLANQERRCSTDTRLPQ